MESLPQELDQELWTQGKEVATGSIISSGTVMWLEDTKVYYSKSRTELAPIDRPSGQIKASRSQKIYVTGKDARVKD
jgi:hypothetical protein